MKSSICSIALREFGIKYTNRYLSELISNTPYMRTFWGVSSVLNRYNVTTNGVRFVEKDRVDNDDMPFICHQNDELVLVQAPKDGDNHLKLIDENGIVTYKTRDEFLRSWDKQALLLHYNNDSKEPDYSINQRRVKIESFKNWTLNMFVLSLIFIGLYYNYNIRDWFWWIILAVNILGLYVSYLLLQKQLHIPNAIASKICSFAKKS